MRTAQGDVMQTASRLDKNRKGNESVGGRGSALCIQSLELGRGRRDMRSSDRHLKRIAISRYSPTPHCSNTTAKIFSVHLPMRTIRIPSASSPKLRTAIAKPTTISMRGNNRKTTSFSRKYVGKVCLKKQTNKTQ
ncbi:hypothetical protein AAMO2058_001535900 [Amorphochlora amoebiformis]